MSGPVPGFTEFYWFLPSFTWLNNGHKIGHKIGQGFVPISYRVDLLSNADELLGPWPIARFLIGVNDVIIQREPIIGRWIRPSVRSLAENDVVWAETSQGSDGGGTRRSEPMIRWLVGGE